MPRPSLKHDYKGCGEPLFHELRWQRGASRKKLEHSQDSALICGMYFRSPFSPPGGWHRVKKILCSRCMRRLGIEW